MAALQKLPYIPLNVSDFSSDEKLRMCSAEATGVYIRLMCILHKSQDYGKLHLQESFVYTKPDTKTIQTPIQNLRTKEILYSEFAKSLARQMPFAVETIKIGLLELDYYGVIHLDGKTLYQPRMVKDAKLSETRRKSVNKRWNGANKDEEQTHFVYAKPDTKPDTKAIQTLIQNVYKSDTNDNTDNANLYANDKKKEHYIYNNNNIYNNNIYAEEKEKGVQGERKRGRKPTINFTPPTQAEVAKYCEERANGIDAAHFVDFYEANGWVQGKQGKPIKDWKAAVRTWERNGITANQGTNGRQATSQTGRSSEVQPTPAEKKTRHTSL